MSENVAFQFDPTLDRVYLSQFYDDDISYASDMFKTFLEYCPQEFEQLLPLLEERKWDEFQFKLHKLTPALAMVGLTILAQQLSNLKERVRDNPNASEMEALLRQIQSRFQEKIPLLEKELERMQREL